ncbi:hypothetical protein EDB19DRAFT_1913889 [Suillus lakei]|nr:hypothetical protein EDB19DRAFT_1913889 [Suillus lakei]
MDRAATQSNTITQTAANHTNTYKCGKCRDVIEYGIHADWPTVSIIVNTHLAACRAKLNFDGPAPSHPPSETHSMRKSPSPLHDFIGDMGADHDGNYDDKFIAGYSKQRKPEAQRKQELEDDEYTYSVCPTSVGCHGCKKEIKLDRRSKYYPGLWTKHRRTCKGIRRTEQDKLARSGDYVCPSNTRRRPTAARPFEINNLQAASISQAANSVANNVSRPMELSDDEDLEEDDTPFSTSNQQFYNKCWQRGERPWKYRYSTTEEILENNYGC